MERIDAVVQSYPWGSRTMIAELMGEATPTQRPWAEAWFGAHPLSSSTVAGAPLSEVIAEDPVAALAHGADVHNGELPFLVKILAAEEPLSLQAHPTLEQAQEGFVRENAEGIPATAPHRNYRDDNHKPELIVALTEFDALAGFRPVAKTRELFAQLDVPGLEHYTVMLDGDNDAEALRALFTTWLTLPQHVLEGLVDAVQNSCADIVEHPDLVEPWVAQVAETTVAIAERYPHDPGVLGSLLLNRINLQPGEAIYMGAGKLHAYLSGLGIEVMANSDNVLRGGLTSKHVDVVELLRVLSFVPSPDPVVRPIVDGESRRYETPATEFQLHTYELGAGQTAELDIEGAAIMLVTHGKAVVESSAGQVALARGAASWSDARETDRVVRADSTDGAQVFVVSVPV